MGRHNHLKLTIANALSVAGGSGEGSAVSGACYGGLGTCFEILEKLLQTVESFGFEMLGVWHDLLGVWHTKLGVWHTPLLGKSPHGILTTAMNAPPPHPPFSSPQTT